MHRLYLDEFQAALQELNARVQGHWRPRDFHIAIPRYTTTSHAGSRWLLYLGHTLVEHGRAGAEFFLKALRFGGRRIFPWLFSQN